MYRKLTLNRDFCLAGTGPGPSRWGTGFLPGGRDRPGKAGETRQLPGCSGQTDGKPISPFIEKRYLKQFYQVVLSRYVPHDVLI